MNKKFLFGTFLLVAIILSLSMIGFILLNDDSTSKDDTNNNGSSVSSPVDTSSPTNTAEATDGTEDWIEYVDPDYGFSFKYPKEWELAHNEFVNENALYKRLEVLSSKEISLLINVSPQASESDGPDPKSGGLIDANYINLWDEILVGDTTAFISNLEHINSSLIAPGPGYIFKVNFIEPSNESYSSIYIKNHIGHEFSIVFPVGAKDITQSDISNLLIIIKNFKWSNK